MTGVELSCCVDGMDIADSFIPPVWLKHPHIQTLLGRFINVPPPARYQRERIETPDDDFIDLDWLWHGPARPTVLICHGLEGCSQSIYIRRIMKSIQALGWNAAVMHFRCCSGAPNRQPRMYHSGDTGDLRFVLEWICRTRGFGPLSLLGYSLGGNVVCKWLGETGHDAARWVGQACVCCAPFDLRTCQTRLDRGFNRHVYCRHFLRSLKKKVRWKMDLLSGRVDLESGLSATTMYQFDEAITAPLHGFDNALDYYRKASSKPWLKHIEVPLLVIHSLDDPLVPSSVVPGREEINPQTTRRLITRRGGHLGFITRDGSNWLEDRIVSWFQAGVSPRG